MPDPGGWTHVPSLPEAVADWIGTGIVSGRWGEGDRLLETEIAAELGTSRAPVREAIRILHARGLVEHRPRSGATVKAFSLATIREVYAVRAALESWIVSQSVPHLTEGDQAELAQLLKEMAAFKSRGDRDAFFDAGWAFRQVLYRGYPNQFALGLVDTLRSRLHSLPQVLRSEDTTHVQKTLLAYRAITRYTGQQRADKAARALADFLIDAGEQMCALFAAQFTPVTPRAPHVEQAGPGAAPIHNGRRRPDVTRWAAD